MEHIQTPPRLFERFARAGAYACIGLSGIWLMLSPSPSMSGALGHWLTIIWSCFLLTAIPAVIFTLIGRYRVEYALLPWFGGALLLAVIHEWFGLGHGVPRALFDTALICWFVVRFVSLHALVKVRVRGGRRGR